MIPDNRSTVRNVIENRAAREKGAVGNEHDAGTRPTIAGIVCNRDCATNLKIKIKHDHIDTAYQPVVRRVRLTVDDSPSRFRAAPDDATKCAPDPDYLQKSIPPFQLQRRGTAADVYCAGIFDCEY